MILSNKTYSTTVNTHFKIQIDCHKRQYIYMKLKRRKTNILTDGFNIYIIKFIWFDNV